MQCCPDTENSNNNYITLFIRVAIIAKAIGLKSLPSTSDGPFDHRPSNGDRRGKLRLRVLGEKKRRN